MSYRKVENIHDRRCGMYKNFGFSSALDSSNVYDDPRLWNKKTRFLEWLFTDKNGTGRIEHANR